MKIAWAFYVLEGKRKGALIRVEEGESRGYADLHPWPELGDAPLERQLSERNSPLWQRTIAFAKIDAAARKESKNLLKLAPLPKSYLLLWDLKESAEVSGSNVLKIKVGRSPKEEIERLLELGKRGLKLRLDFNNRTDKSGFDDYMRQIGPVHEQIEYIEDPYPYEPKAWVTSQKFWKCKFALDDRSERGIGQKEAAPVLILKPARQDEGPFKKAIDAGQRVVVTSSLDHPLGQCAAAWVASQFPEEICGLASHRVYPRTPFSEEIDHPESLFRAPSGTGFGFDKQLLELEWTDGRN